MKRNVPTRKKVNAGGIQSRINAIRSKIPQRKKSVELTPPGDNILRMKKDTFDLLEKPETKPEDEAFLQNFARQLQDRQGGRSKGLRETPATQRDDHVNKSLKAYSKVTAKSSDSSNEDCDHTRKINAARKARSVVTASARARQGSASPPPPETQEKKPLRKPKMTTSSDLPPEGSILHLSTGQIVIFDRDVPGQRYQMALVLNPDGSLTAEGLNLRLGCEYNMIGSMPPEDVIGLHIAKTWHRAQITMHLDRYEDADLIPGKSHKAQTTPTPKPTPPAPSPPPALSATPKTDKKDPSPPANPQNASTGQNGIDELVENGMQRGQRFRLNMGGKRTWDAIFWGGDGTGTMMVHKTHGDWALTRLDLSRFAEKNIILEDMMSEREIWEMKEILKRTYT